MRVVFAGTPGIAVPTLDHLVQAGHDVAAVISQPSRPAGRSSEPVLPAVAARAVELGIELHQPRKVRNAAFRELLSSCTPDLLVVVAYGRILPAAVLEIPRIGPVNVHFSLLPLYRGAAPVQWCLAHGDRVTGVTTMFMNDRMDEGDVLLQREVAIEDGEHSPALQRRLAVAGAELLLETVSGLEQGSLEPRPQDHAAATHAPPLRPEDGRADPAWPAAKIEGRVRGFDPWPGVWLRRGDRRLRLIEVVAGEYRGPEAVGTIIAEGKRDLPRMVCGAGSALELRRVQPEGRRVLTGRDALNGRQLVAGERLESWPPAG